MNKTRKVSVELTAGRELINLTVYVMVTELVEAILFNTTVLPFIVVTNTSKFCCDDC